MPLDENRRNRSRTQTDQRKRSSGRKKGRSKGGRKKNRSKDKENRRNEGNRQKVPSKENRSKAQNVKPKQEEGWKFRLGKGNEGFSNRNDDSTKRILRKEEARHHAINPLDLSEKMLRYFESVDAEKGEKPVSGLRPVPAEYPGMETLSLSPSDVTVQTGAPEQDVEKWIEAYDASSMSLRAFEDMIYGKIHNKRTGTWTQRFANRRSRPKYLKLLFYQRGLLLKEHFVTDWELFGVQLSGARKILRRQYSHCRAALQTKQMFRALTDRGKRDWIAFQTVDHEHLRRLTLRLDCPTLKKMHLGFLNFVETFIKLPRTRDFMQSRFTELLDNEGVALANKSNLEYIAIHSMVGNELVGELTKPPFSKETSSIKQLFNNLLHFDQLGAIIATKTIGPRWERFQREHDSTQRQIKKQSDNLKKTWSMDERSLNVLDIVQDTHFAVISRHLRSSIKRAVYNRRALNKFISSMYDGFGEVEKIGGWVQKAFQMSFIDARRSALHRWHKKQKRKSCNIHVLQNIVVQNKIHHDREAIRADLGEPTRSPSAEALRTNLEAPPTISDDRTGSSSHISSLNADEMDLISDYKSKMRVTRGHYLDQFTLLKKFWTQAHTYAKKETTAVQRLLNQQVLLQSIVFLPDPRAVHHGELPVNFKFQNLLKESAGARADLDQLYDTAKKSGKIGVRRLIYTDREIGLTRAGVGERVWGEHQHFSPDGCSYKTGSSSGTEWSFEQPSFEVSAPEGFRIPGAEVLGMDPTNWKHTLDSVMDRIREPLAAPDPGTLWPLEGPNLHELGRRDATLRGTKLAILTRQQTLMLFTPLPEEERPRLSTVVLQVGDKGFMARNQGQYGTAVLPIFQMAIREFTRIRTRRSSLEFSWVEQRKGHPDKEKSLKILLESEDAMLAWKAQLKQACAPEDRMFLKQNQAPAHPNRRFANEFF